MLYVTFGQENSRWNIFKIESEKLLQKIKLQYFDKNVIFVQYLFLDALASLDFAFVSKSVGRSFEF